MKPSGVVAGDVVVRTGNLFVEIFRCAEDISADLIVMGTHGRGPIEHTWQHRGEGRAQGAVSDDDGAPSRLQA